MLKTQLTIILIVLQVICLQCISSVPVPQSELNGFIQLLTAYGLSSSTVTADNVCSYSSGSNQAGCKTTSGAPYQNINYIRLYPGQSAQNAVIAATLFAPFTYLDMLITGSINAGNQFLADLNQQAPNCTYIKCTLCKINQVPSNCNYKTLYLQNNDFRGTHNLSEVSRFPEFSNDNGNYPDINWVSDLTTKLTINHTGLTLYTSSFPDLSKYVMISYLIINPTSSFPSGDITNFEKIPTVANVWFNRDSNKGDSVVLRFPKFLETYKSYNLNRWSFISQYVNWSISEAIDLSQTNLMMFRVQRSQFYLEDNSGNYPIINTNPGVQNVELSFISTLKTMNMSVVRKNYINNYIGSQITMNNIPDMTLYDTDAIAWTFIPDNNMTRIGNGLAIDINSISGTIPKFFCNLEMSFSTNMFSGILPPCFACYLNSTTTRNRVTNNQFSNYQDTMTPSQYPACTTIKIDNYFVGYSNPFGFPQYDYNFYIVGMDFGVKSQINVVVPGYSSTLSMTPLRNNEIYYLPISNTQAINAINSSSTTQITFVAPNITIVLNTTGIFNNYVPFNSTFYYPFPPKPSSSSNSTTSTTGTPTSTNSTTSATSNPTTGVTGTPTSSTSPTSTGEIGSSSKLSTTSFLILSIIIVLSIIF